MGVGWWTLVSAWAWMRVCGHDVTHSGTGLPTNSECASGQRTFQSEKH